MLWNGVRIEQHTISLIFKMNRIVIGLLVDAYWLLLAEALVSLVADRLEVYRLLELGLDWNFPRRDSIVSLLVKIFFILEEVHGLASFIGSCIMSCLRNNGVCLWQPYYFNAAFVKMCPFLWNGMLAWSSSSLNFTSRLVVWVAVIPSKIISCICL